MCALGPEEEVLIINVLMWVSTARRCRAACLDWNKLTSSCVYIIDDDGRKGEIEYCFDRCVLAKVN